jgi:hypothetical protein
LFNQFTFFSFYFFILSIPVALSFMDTMAPLLFLPIIVSISKSPKRCFKSTISGRFSINILLLKTPLEPLYFLFLYTFSQLFVDLNTNSPFFFIFPNMLINRLCGHMTIRFLSKPTILDLTLDGVFFNPLFNFNC